MNNKKYYLGLDIGTNSVGWAVTDENYKLVKKDGKHLWGARLFEEGKDAQSRRKNRNNRRRLKRRRERILILRDLFLDEINKIDPNFFKRLDLSFFWKDDIEEAKEYLKINGNIKNNYLFEDKNKLKEYYKKYKTIYHLRKDLLDNKDKKFDIRLIYLAISHIIKYRGNFLYSNFNDVDSLDLITKFNEVNELLLEVYHDELNKFNINIEKENKLKNLFKTEAGKNKLKEEFKSIFEIKQKSKLNSLIELMNGSEKTIESLFPYLKDEKDEDVLKEKINLGKEDYIVKIETNLNEYEILLINKIKEIHDIRIMLFTLKDEKSISYSMVKLYEEHKNQLQVFKKLIKKYIPEERKWFFNENPNTSKSKDTNISYAKYVGFSNNKKFKLGKDSVDYSKFINTCKDLMDKIKKKDINESDKEKIENIDKAIENNTFLLKQNSKNNGVLPYQLNKNELKTIIENQSKFYPFLKEKDKSFIDPNKKEYKLISLLEYKIPYFVGPLSEKMKSNSKYLSNHWAVKKSNEKIYPWNFYDVIDEKESSNKFMENLRNTCTYIKQEETLPKKSIYFQVFCCLNELNSFLLNGNKFAECLLPNYNNKTLLQVILEELYLKQKNIKFKDIKNKIKEIYPVEQKDEKGNMIYHFTTKKIDGEIDKLNEIIKTDLSTIIDFEKIFGERFYNDSIKLTLVENIVKYLSIFTEDKPLRNALNSLKLSEEQINQILKLKGYSKFSTLSKKLLVELKTPNVTILKTGEVLTNLSILETMLKTGFNFQEVYETKDSNFTFKKQVEKINDDYFNEHKLSIKDQIEEYPLSNIAKRPLRQVYKIVEELNHILNKDYKDEDSKISCFSRIFIETTREKDKSKQGKISTSRKKQLELYFKEAKKLNYELFNLENELNEHEKELKSNKIFLYFTQLGRDVYTGEKIDLSTLLTTNNIYDIDHILPQSLIKNNSFENIVLTKKEFNNNKQNKYPFGDLIKKEGIDWIKKLNNIKVNKISIYMPNNKMNSITRLPAKPITSDELAGFINRQLPITNQANKYSMELLKSMTNGEVIYSKASYVSDFREIFKLYKIREANNFHHAHDALLNIVVGDIYDQKFTNLRTKAQLEKLKVICNEEEFKARTNLDPRRILKWEIKGRNSDNILWDKLVLKKEGLDKEKLENYTNKQLELIKKQLSYYDVLISYMRRTNVGKQGMFNKITVKPNGKDAKDYVKLKDNDLFNPIKYGGYTDLTTSYFALVSNIDKKDNKNYHLIDIPLNISIKLNDKYTIYDYIKESDKYHDYKIECEKILINDLVCYPIKDSKYYREYIIAGNTGLPGYLNPHYSLIKDFKYVKYIYEICKIVGDNKFDTLIYKNENEESLIKETKENVIYNFNIKKNNELFNYLKEKLNIFKVKETISKSCIDFMNSFDISILPLYEKDDEGKVSSPQLVFLYNFIRLLSGDKQPDFRYGKKENQIGKSGWGKASFVKNKLPIGTKFIKLSATGFYKKVIFEVK